jgi:hypothetical protein
MRSAMLALGALLSVSVFGAAPASAADGDPLFRSNEPLRVKISAPLRDIARDRDAVAAYRPGTVAFTDADGSLRELPVQFRPRGKSRRFNKYCQVPPLRLKMPKDEVRGTLFQGQNNLKLVTHCRTSNRHDAFIQKEYLVYRILNQITDTSFRVRALDVEYVDSARPGDSEHRFGFLVEDKRRLAKRLGLKVANVERLSPGDLEPMHTDLMDLFEFMISNTDFSFISPPGGGSKECCHNAVPMSLNAGSGPYLQMPYDFDMSGFVNPPYAVVDGQLPISNVRQRLYRGFCRPGDGTAQAVARMQEARPAVFEVLRTETALEERVRKDVVTFIEAFYAILDDPRQLQRRVINACRKV